MLASTNPTPNSLFPRVSEQPIVWWHVSATLFFLPQRITFSKDILLCAMCATQYFFLNNVLWQVCHNTFLKKYCVVCHVRNTIFF